MARNVKWGILGVGSFLRRRFMPALQQCEQTEVVAIASRSADKSRAFAKETDIPKAYGSYEELLADPEVEVVYNTLPNHLHVPWSMEAARKGKHVLCEKPLGVCAKEVRKLQEVRDECNVKIAEAFMVRTHPQWVRTEELVRSGRIGKLRSSVGYFSYFNVDPANTRNVPEFGGGGLYDIGCYPIKTTRFVFAEEPVRVFGCMERDPSFKTDRLTSVILEYPSGQAIFTCSTQTAYYQRMIFLGTEGRIDVEIPFNAPTDRPTRIFIDNCTDLLGTGLTTESFPVCNQFTIQADLFSAAVRENKEVVNPLEDAICNAAVIEAVFRSADSGKWEVPERL